MQDGIDLSNKLNQDSIDIQGSATLTGAAADTVAEDFGFVSTLTFALAYLALPS